MKKTKEVFDVELEMTLINESYKRCLLNKKSNDDYDLELNEDARNLGFRVDDYFPENY